MINCYDSVTNDCKRVASILLRFVNILSTRLQKDEKSCFNCVPGYVWYQIFDLIPSYNTTSVIKVLMLQESFILIFRNNISQDHFSTIKDNGFYTKLQHFTWVFDEIFIQCSFYQTLNEPSIYVCASCSTSRVPIQSTLLWRLIITLV